MRQAKDAAVAGAVEMADGGWERAPLPVEVEWQREAAPAEPAVPAGAIVVGAHVGLWRAQPDDARSVWRWLAQGELASRRYGPPLYPDHVAPSYDAFRNDFPAHFFDGSQPYEGRGFVIRAVDGARTLGFICHDRLDLRGDVTTLDLWLVDRSVCGHGYGSEALLLLTDWLQAQRGINRFLLRPARSNVRALRAARRAGFRETDMPAAQVLAKLALPRGEYADELLMFRMLPLPPQRLEPAADRLHVCVDSEFTRLAQPQLLSFGAAADDGARFYGEIAERFDERVQPLAERCSEFVRDTVLPLLDGPRLPRAALAAQFVDWLRARGERVTLVSDSGYDRWAIAELLQSEDLPEGVDWLRVPVAYRLLDQAAASLELRRHHALDDALTLRCVLTDEAL